jgi:hypothetical protein
MDFLPSLLDEACPVSRGMGRVVLDIVVNRGGGSRGGGGGCGRSEDFGSGLGQLSPVGIKGVAFLFLPETLFGLV